MATELWTGGGGGRSGTAHDAMSLRGPPVTHASDHGNRLCAVQRGGRGRCHGNTSCHGNSSDGEGRAHSRLKRQELVRDVMTCVVL